MGTRLYPSGRLEISNVDLRELLYEAYVSTDGPTRVTGGPKWLGSDKFDITAKLDDDDVARWPKLSEHQRQDIRREALRRLLEDRFGVKVHTEVRVEPVYAVVQANTGAKLKEVPAPAPPTPEQLEASRNATMSGERPLPGSSWVTGTKWVATAVAMGGVVGQLSYFCNAMDRPVINATGLKGYYDLTVTFSQEKDGPTREQQIEEQLGLKVESRKAPVTVYVVDAAEKPSEN
jgi:uncharacterized protein (TIGR03435 family)